jgi:hypothetical protein
MKPFRQAITILTVSNKVFRTMFLKTDTVRIIQRWVYVCLSRLFYGWRAVFRWETILLLPLMEESYICLVYQMWMFVLIVQRQLKSLSTLGVFWHGCRKPIRHRTIGNTDETLLSRCEETLARLQNSDTQDIIFYQYLGASLEKCCTKIQPLKMNSIRNPFWRTLPLIFEILCTR